MFGRDGIYHVKVVLSAKYEKVSACQVACLKSISTRTLGLSRQFKRIFWKAAVSFGLTAPLVNLNSEFSWATNV